LVIGFWQVSKTWLPKTYSFDFCYENLCRDDDTSIVRNIFNIVSCLSIIAPSHQETRYLRQTNSPRPDKSSQIRGRDGIPKNYKTPYAEFFLERQRRGAGSGFGWDGLDQTD
jgi:hypothetical protein